MRTLPSGLEAHLAGGVTTLCWCWTLTTHDGRVMGFTDHDRDIAFDGVTFEAATGFDGTESESSLGLGVDNLDVSGMLRSDRLNEADLAAGVFDNALIEMWLVNWQAPAERALMRRGNLGEVTRSTHAFSAEVRGLAHRLDQTTGRLYRHGCDADLGDARCGIDPESPVYRGTGTVVRVEDSHRFAVTGLEAFADGWFARGRLRWTHGANEGRAMEVKVHRVAASGTVIGLWQAMAEPVEAGDGFAVTAGCDKQFSTCRGKFANGYNFRGFPQMPGNDFAISYPRRDDPDNDGNSRWGG